ncbi:MAG TPA: hypothetical protein VFJ47_08640, partial [Terriglobales bacterium]|nr:hypothetical protein [Terriglobales bacterium]
MPGTSLHHKGDSILTPHAFGNTSMPRPGCFQNLSACLLLTLLLLPCFNAFASEPPWLEIHGRYFSVITDAGEKRGREAALRMEQMRTVFGSLLMRSRLNMPVPLTVIALKDAQPYNAAAPGTPPSAPGFLVTGEDHIYVVLNLSADEPWRAVAHDFARLLLNYNYPSTQPWFDEGLAEYFSSLWVTDKQVEIGGDPELNSAHPFTDVLKTSAWIPITQLFSTQSTNSDAHENARAGLFPAESWIVMHYIINQQKLTEAGTYFDLVQNQKIPVDQAVAKAFGMPPAQFEQVIKDYFRSLGTTASNRAGGSRPASTPTTVQPHQFPAPLGPDDLGVTVTPMPEPDGRALLSDVMVRLPEHHAAGVKQLEDLAAANNETAHRVLAWEKIQEKEFDAATQELGAAAELNRRDMWIRYYLAALKYRMAQNTHGPIQGLANMMQDLRAVLDWYPEFAEAYNMLAMARVEGGGMNSALEAIRAAIQLSPRNEQYVYNLGLVYLSGKKWDPARAIFERLQTSRDPRLAAAAASQLQEIQAKQKYGIPLQHPASANEKPPVPTPQTTAAPQVSQPEPEVQDTERKPEAPHPATGPIEFAKGKLVSVDCSRAPIAVLTIIVKGKMLKLQTPDYKSLTLIGADTFSCQWEDRQVSV